MDTVTQHGFAANHGYRCWTGSGPRAASILDRPAVLRPAEATPIDPPAWLGRWNKPPRRGDAEKIYWFESLRASAVFIAAAKPAFATANVPMQIVAALKDSKI